MTASFALALDTTAPVLRIYAPESVKPPDDLTVAVTADEPLGPVSMAVVDSIGTLTQVGFQRVTDRSLRLVLPTATIPNGVATLHLSVADEVLNITQESISFTVERPRVFEVELTIGHVHDVDLAQDGAFEVDLIFTHAHEVDATLDGAYEVVFDLDHAHAVNLEVF